VPLALLIAAAVILGGVIIVAMGRGGELARFPADVSPFDAQIVTAADVVLLRPPSALFGYNRQVTDDVLSTIARTITERDVEIATLRVQLGEREGPPPQDPPSAPAGRPPPGQRPPVIRRGPARPPGPPPHTWSAWPPPGPASGPSGRPVPGSSTRPPQPDPDDQPGPDPDAAGDAG